MRYVKRLVDFVIQSRQGHPDLEFAWLDVRPIDPSDQAKILDTFVKNGTYTHDEARDVLSLEPLPDGAGAQAMIITAQGPILLKNVEALGEQQLNPPPPPMPRSDAAANGEGASEGKPVPSKGGAGKPDKANGKSPAKTPDAM